MISGTGPLSTSASPKRTQDYYDDDEHLAAEESLEQSYRDRPNVRRLTPRRRSQGYDDWTESGRGAQA